MKWRMINSGFNTGEMNMQFDIALTKSLPENEAVLRLYRWKPFCISLGANQDKDNINLKKAIEDKIDVVKRPTGGRAILHAEELTYSVAYPASGELSPKHLYSEINLALKKGLTFYNSDLADVELENKQTDFPEFYKEEKSTLCFAASAKSELNFNRKKLVGSAQRKMNKSYLQHGSILCGKKHLDIIHYLNLPLSILVNLKQEIEQTTIEIETITGTKVDYDLLIEAIKSGFEEHFNFRFESPIALGKNDLTIPG
jgi:lipoyl(octanoyl) transferase